MQDIVNLLFVCVRNRVRSPFAEFLFRKMLKESKNESDQRIKVSSAGFQPTELRELLIRENVSPPEPFYGVSMSEPTMEELKKRGVSPPKGWTSKELVPDDVHLPSEQKCITLYIRARQSTAAR